MRRMRAAPTSCMCVRAEEGGPAGRWARGGGQAGSAGQIPTVLEDSPIAQEQQPWPPSVGWALGPRAQQPYPENAASVMQAFRGLSMQARLFSPPATPLCVLPGRLSR